MSGEVETRMANVWYEEVGEIEVEPTAKQKRYRRGKCAGGLNVNCWSVYKLSKRSAQQRADDMLNEQRDLTKRPPSKSVIETIESEPIENQPSTQQMLKKLLDSIGDPNIGIIGVYGRRGVGKTTLVNKVHNHLIGKEIENYPFDTVIMVTVSATPDIPNIQTQIGNRLNLDLSNYNEDDAQEKLLDVLGKKKFLLILDDVWQTLEFKDVGIPHPRNHKGCKILITTRAKDICSHMNADIKMKVQRLSRDESWNLFVEKAGQHVTSHPINRFAEIIVAKCGGLPLALVTIAGAMAGRATVEEWADAIRQMEQPATNSPGLYSPDFLLDESDVDSDTFRETSDVRPKFEPILKMSLSGLRDGEFQKFGAPSNYALEWEIIGEPVRSASSKVKAQIRELEMPEEPDDQLPLVQTYHETVRSKLGKEQPSSMETKINEASTSKVANFSKVCESFQNLQEPLKSCVFYTSTLFPGDYEFEEDTLIQLWIAAGFIQTELEQLVERGQTYFKVLHELSIFQKSSTVRKNYDPTTYRVHKDVYELKQQGFPDEYSTMDEGGPAEISPSTMHSTLLLGGNGTDFDSKIFERFYKAKNLRTFKLQIEYGSPIKHVPHILFVKLGSLRVLDLSSTEIKELPTSVRNLKHLRYLDVSGTPIKRLPESVCELNDLQTLKLRDCSNLVGLPKGTSKLINLQHLDLDGLYQLTSMPLGMGQLTNLQKLSIFVVGREPGFRIEELKSMKKLRGSLCIAKMENVTEDQASVAELGDKVAIHSLEFKWSSSQSKGGTKFNLIEPHSSIKQLKITRYGATSFPKWLSGENFASLAILHLSYCNCTHLPALGKLHSLESLYINQMHSLEKIGDEFYGGELFHGVAFSKLELLEIDGMPRLEEWKAIQKCDMPKLRELTIIDCPRLVILPNFMNLKSLQHLRIILCPEIQSFPGERLPESLQSLTITECPKLKEQCQKKDGDEWCKMACIPEIWIDYEQQPKISIQAKESESLRGEEKKNGRKEQLERERQELDKSRSHRDQVNEELRIAQDQNVKLESQIADSDRMGVELVEKKVLSAAQQSVAIQTELDELQELSEKNTQFFSVFSAKDIVSATESFDPSLKIGTGAFGDVYKGVLRQTPVAIKKFSLHSLEDQSRSGFQREVDVLSKVRHPNLVTLIGVCPEASALVFEYLPNGSLEDRLTCKDCTPPLSWKDRIRIAKEICLALIFLHSNRPYIIVHGDLKPSHILLDVNFVSKLGGFGIAKLIPRDENCPDIAEGSTISDIEPEISETGVLTSEADVYSFGVVLLRLLTGRPAEGIVKEVELVLDEGNLIAILDTSAGVWPLVQAKQLAQMALRCCDMKATNRPNLELEVWELFQSLENESYMSQQDEGPSGPAKDKSTSRPRHRFMRGRKAYGIKGLCMKLL